MQTNFDFFNGFGKKGMFPFKNMWFIWSANTLLRVFLVQNIYKKIEVNLMSTHYVNLKLWVNQFLISEIKDELDYSWN